MDDLHGNRIHHKMKIASFTMQRLVLRGSATWGSACTPPKDSYIGNLPGSAFIFQPKSKCLLKRQTMPQGGSIRDAKKTIFKVLQYALLLCVDYKNLHV